MFLPSRLAATRTALLAGLLGLAAFVFAPAALAQSGASPGGSTLQNLINQLGNTGLTSPSAIPGQTSNPVTTIQPNLPPLVPLPVSELEKYYSGRAATQLEQFGYESLGRPEPASSVQMGALQDTYILGPGDLIDVSTIGQANQDLTARVDSDGTIRFPGLAPISAAGRRLGDVRAEIEAKVKKAYMATQVFVSVGAVRQIRVLVSGEVGTPGPVLLNALNSPVDAILLAGGVKKTGSLRQIKIIRGDETIPIDLYAVLSSSGGTLHASLSDGDKIVVPPIGPTVAVAGDVTRPGIFEVGPGQRTISSRALLALAGGYARGGNPRLNVLKVQSNGVDVMTPVSAAGTTLAKGDILFVAPENSIARGRVVLEGQVRLPGMYDIERVHSLKGLLGSPDVFEEQPYMQFAVVSRRDAATLARKLIPFSPQRVLSGDFDLALQDDDIVHIFSIGEVRDLAMQFAAQDLTGTATSRYQNSVSQLQQAIANQESSQYQPVSPSLPVSPTTVQPGYSPSGTAIQQTTIQPTVPYAATTGGGIIPLASQEQQPVLPLAQGPVSQYMQPVWPALPTTQPATGATAAPPVATGPYPSITQPRQQAQTNQLQAGQLPTGPYGPYQANQPSQFGSQFYNPPTMPSALPPWMPGAPQSTTPQGPLSSQNLLVDLSDPAVIADLANYRVTLLGEVQVPGDYLAAPGAGLDGLVAAAGGLTVSADLTGVEVTSSIPDAETGKTTTTRSTFDLGVGQLGRISLRPGDVIRFRELYSDRDQGQVSVSGQVKYPGAFDLLRGERLSSLLTRAGGLTEVAYPYGAVFTRQSAADAEERGYRRAADELESSYTVIISSGKTTPEAVQFIRDTINRLETARGVGRVSVVADPVQLAANPSRDMLLEPGDTLFIPRRPNSVSVTGEVLNAGSYVYTSGDDGRHYIELSGGFGPDADRRHTFILMPDGTARPLEDSLLRFREAKIVPGATIIVPRNLEPLRLGDFIPSLTQVMSQLAVSAASIAVISRNQ